MALHATLLAVVLSVVICRASLYDHKRGFATYNLPEADVQSYLKQHEPSTIINRHKNSETLKEHPEVKRFLEWRTLHKAGHPSAGAAFAGQIPHDFIPHLSKSKHTAEPAAEQAFRPDEL